MAKLREHGIEQLEEVKAATMESDGEISVIKHDGTDAAPPPGAGTRAARAEAGPISNARPSCSTMAARGDAAPPRPPLTAMSLSTIIHAGLTRPSRPIHALVLMGGGARTAYQVGVLQALAAMLELQRRQRARTFPFQVLVGTSAGALNVAYLAGAATHGPAGLRPAGAILGRPAFGRRLRAGRARAGCASAGWSRR